MTKFWRICDDCMINLWFFENRAPGVELLKRTAGGEALTAFILFDAHRCFVAHAQYVNWIRRRFRIFFQLKFRRQIRLSAPAEVGSVVHCRHSACFSDTEWLAYLGGERCQSSAARRPIRRLCRKNPIATLLLTSFFVTEACCWNCLRSNEAWRYYSSRQFFAVSAVCWDLWPEEKGRGTCETDSSCKPDNPPVALSKRLSCRNSSGNASIRWPEQVAYAKYRLHKYK